MDRDGVAGAGHLRPDLPDLDRGSGAARGVLQRLQRLADGILPGGARPADRRADAAGDPGRRARPSCSASIAKGGVRQVTLMIANINPKLDDPAWEPLWQALEESGIILSWHITVFGRQAGRPRRRQGRQRVREHEILHGEFSRAVRRSVRLGHSRTPSRGCKMVMAEAGTGWLPWLVQELDYRHWRLWEAKEFWADKGGMRTRNQAVASCSSGRSGRRSRKITWRWR